MLVSSPKLFIVYYPKDKFNYLTLRKFNVGLCLRLFTVCIKYINLVYIKLSVHKKVRDGIYNISK